MMHGCWVKKLLRPAWTLARALFESTPWEPSSVDDAGEHRGEHE
jgi:hypothetical protein